MTRLNEILTTWGAKPVILVEGKDDLHFYEHFLGGVDANWRVRFGMDYADGKRFVLQYCKQRPTWRGVIDRDEWSAAKIAEETALVPNVQVLPRFTLQNYWINPDDLLPLLPAEQQIQSSIRQEIDAQRANWVLHGALWRVMLNRRRGLEELNFPRELMQSPITDENQIRRILTQWHQQLSPEAIMDEYRLEQTRAAVCVPGDQYNLVIHGKMFFKEVVVPAMNRTLRQKAASIWEKELTRKMKMPGDLLPVVMQLLKL